MLDPKIIKNLNCPICRTRLNFNLDNFNCPICHRVYPVRGNLVLINEFSGDKSAKNSDGLISRLKNILKKYSKLYNFLYYAFGALLLGLTAKQAIKNLGGDKIILNLGSGVKRIRPDVINLDFYPFPSVDILVDISRLPFADNSVDAVINEFVLEHIQQPTAAVAEMKRILKPGGLIYISLPFIENFHSSPHDYNRWTKMGLRTLMQDFQEEKIGIRSGPASALVSILNEWLALLLSFGSRRLEQLWLMFFMVATSPLRLFDFLMCRLPNADNISFAFYYLGRKK